MESRKALLEEFFVAPVRSHVYATINTYAESYLRGDVGASDIVWKLLIQTLRNAAEVTLLAERLTSPGCHQIETYLWSFPFEDYCWYDGTVDRDGDGWDKFGHRLYWDRLYKEDRPIVEAFRHCSPFCTVASRPTVVVMIDEWCELFRRKEIRASAMVREVLIRSLHCEGEVRHLVDCLSSGELSRMLSFTNLYPRTSYGWAQLPVARESLPQTEAEILDDWRRPHLEDRQVVEAFRRFLEEKLR